MFDATNSFIECRRHAFTERQLCHTGLGLAAAVFLSFNLGAVHADKRVEAKATDTSVKALPAPANLLASYFDAAKDLDRQIRDATSLFETVMKSEPGNVPTGTMRTILELDSRVLVPLLPPGLPSAMEVAVLRTWANLDSRISGLRGTVFHAGVSNPDEDLVIRSQCLGKTRGTQDHFEDDLAAAMASANSQFWTVAATNSVAAAELAIRLKVIFSLNHCCDGCGGEVYDKPFDVNWQNRTVRGVRFDASFNGEEWEIHLHAG